MLISLVVLNLLFSGQEPPLAKSSKSTSILDANYLINDYLKNYLALLIYNLVLSIVFFWSQVQNFLSHAFSFGILHLW